MTDTKKIDEIAISIHVPRVEDDSKAKEERVRTRIFQSTSPVWRTTHLLGGFDISAGKFQSTSPVWRTTVTAHTHIHCDGISIHVPRVEDDLLLH